MSDSIRLPLPNDVYERLVKAADAMGMTPVEWIAFQLSLEQEKRRKETTAEEITEANARLRATMVDLDYATELDNEQIDTDLARKYADTHEPRTSEKDSC